MQSELYYKGTKKKGGHNTRVKKTTHRYTGRPILRPYSAARLHIGLCTKYPPGALLTSKIPSEAKTTSNVCLQLPLYSPILTCIMCLSIDPTFFARMYTQ